MYRRAVSLMGLAVDENITTSVQKMGLIGTNGLM